MRVLVTRPEHDAARTAERLSALGHEAVIDSLLRIEPVAFAPAQGIFQAIAVTSANAFRAVGKKKLAPFLLLPLFAVGEQSAEAAREAGFSQVIAAGGDAYSLAKTIAENLPAHSRVLYLAGADRAQDLSALLAPSEIEVETKVVYRAVPVMQLAQETLARMQQGEIDAVLHYSRRSAEIFLALARKGSNGGAAGGVLHLCLSDAVATPLLEAGFDVKVAAHPNEDALFALLG